MDPKDKARIYKEVERDTLWKLQEKTTQVMFVAYDNWITAPKNKKQEIRKIFEKYRDLTHNYLEKYLALCQN